MDVHKVEALVILTDGRRMLWTFDAPEGSYIRMAMEHFYDEPESYQVAPGAWVHPPAVITSSKAVLGNIGYFQWERADGKQLKIVPDEDDGAPMDKIRKARAALADAVEEMQDMISYVPEYFRDKWMFDDSIVRAKIALEDLKEEEE